MTTTQTSLAAAAAIVGGIAVSATADAKLLDGAAITPTDATETQATVAEGTLDLMTHIAAHTA